MSDRPTPLGALSRGLLAGVAGTAAMTAVQGETEHGHLHAKPSEVGRLAARSGCSQLLLTHVMPELEDEIEPALGLVRESYSGEVVTAEDLMRVAVA